MALDGRIFSGVSVLAAVVEGRSFVKAAGLLGLTPGSAARLSAWRLGLASDC
jgi:hypothetical protein